QRRIGRVGGRAQEPAQHVVFPAGAGSLPMVRARTATRPLLRRRVLVRAGTLGQAAGDYIALRPAALGLLAIAADVCRRGARCNRNRDRLPAKEFFPLAIGKAPASRTL